MPDGNASGKNKPTTKQQMHRKGHWKYAGQRKLHLEDGQSRREMKKTDTHTNQEMIDRGYEEHVMMPTQPAKHFVVVETDFAFRLVNAYCRSA